MKGFETSEIKSINIFTDETVQNDVGNEHELINFHLLILADSIAYYILFVKYPKLTKNHCKSMVFCVFYTDSPPLFVPLSPVASDPEPPESASVPADPVGSDDWPDPALSTSGVPESPDSLICGSVFALPPSEPPESVLSDPDPPVESVDVSPPISAGTVSPEPVTPDEPITCSSC